MMGHKLIASDQEAYPAILIDSMEAKFKWAVWRDPGDNIATTVPHSWRPGMSLELYDLATGSTQSFVYC